MPTCSQSARWFAPTVCSVAITLAAGCTSSGTHAGHTDTSRSVVRTSPSLSTAAYVKESGVICNDQEQKVYKLISSVLKSEVYPSKFPSPEFASFYRQVAQIGADAVTRLEQLSPPAGKASEATTELKIMSTYASWAQATGRDAAKSDGASYQADVKTPYPKWPARPLLPQACEYLELGPGAGG